jgi:hypothetical protein
MHYYLEHYYLTFDDLFTFRPVPVYALYDDESLRPAEEAALLAQLGITPRAPPPEPPSPAALPVFTLYDDESLRPPADALLLAQLTQPAPPAPPSPAAPLPPQSNPHSPAAP